MGEQTEERARQKAEARERAGGWRREMITPFIDRRS